MSLQKYDVRFHSQDYFVEKYWDPVNTPIFDKQGRVKYLIHSVTDVTIAVNIYLANQNFIKWHERDHGPLPDYKSSKAVIMFYGPNLIVRYANNSMLQILGNPSDLVIGRPGLSLFNKVLFKEQLVSALFDTYTFKKPHYLKDLTFWTYDTESPKLGFYTIKYKVDGAFEPIIERDGTIYGVLALFNIKK